MTSAESFFNRWKVIPVLQNRVFIVKDENDANYPGLPISASEYERLRTAKDAQGFQAILLEYKNTGKLRKATGQN
jgi:hypothetical protein